MIIPSFIKNVIALTNSVSEITFFAHHPAVFFTQSGTDSLDFDKFDDSTIIIASFTKNVIALTNSVSEMRLVAHHPAVFFTQSGTDSAFVMGINEINPARSIMKMDTFTIS